MKCKIFTATNGYLDQKLNSTPILLETAINDFLHGAGGIDFKILQTQSGEHGNFLTVTIFY